MLRLLFLLVLLLLQDHLHLLLVEHRIYPNPSVVAAWYCWYSETRSFMFDSASVNSISSMPTGHLVHSNMQWMW